MPTQIVVESLLGADAPKLDPTPTPSNGNGSGRGNGRLPRASEVEYDDIEAPRGHVVRSKRNSAILSGELQAEPPTPDRAVPMEPSIALGAGPQIIPSAADLAIGEATAEVMLIPRSHGSGIVGILLGTVIVVGVAIGAWYVSRATSRGSDSNATAAPTQPQLPAAPVVTPVPPVPPAPTPAPAVEPDEVADPVEVEAVEPAVDPEPTPPVVPVKTEVTIRFSSSPDGARVRIPGAKKFLGTTPFVSTFPRVEGAQAFEFTKAGYDTVTGQVALDVDSALTVALSKKGRPIRRGGGGKPPGGGETKPDPSLDRGGTMDVLGDGH